MGGNPAENHPISFRWVLKAKERGAKLISVDPRFTRSSKIADVYAPMRSGTDIAFIGGLIKYAIDHSLIHEEYVVNYTNASYLVDEKFDFQDGLFTGYDEGKRTYDTSTWKFQKDEAGNIRKDETLEHPRSVFQLLKKQYSRYDVETVCAVTGTPREDFLKVAETFCATGSPDKAGTIMYAMGTTQHTTGTQNVRSYAILQLLLGNIGRPGGGINAQRGESNVQGSTDFGLLYDNIPGYMKAPLANPKYATLKDYNNTETPKGGYWTNKPKFVVSLLKAFYGPNATADNEFGYQYLPKGNKNYSHIAIFENMSKGNIKGMFAFGQNPVVGGPNANKEHLALAKLDWLVAVDLWETETAAFWTKDAGRNPADIKTEVFFLPACSSYEKEGSVSNSGRWMQYRWQAIQPKGESKADLEIIHQLALRIKDLYKNSTDSKSKPIQALHWEYGHGDHPDIDAVAREINGYDYTTGKQLSGFAQLKNDGTTCSGNWIYCGFYPESGNLSKRRDNKDTGMGNFLNWSWAWPMNRRVLYNRASADASGKPWNKDKAVIWWDASQKKWVGHDVSDFVATKAPDAAGGKNPFIMQEDELGSLFAVRKDGPFPEHYEPYESPVSNAFSKVQFNPVSVIWGDDTNKKGNNSQFPIIGTTYRVAEHWQSGSMTRNQEWLSELVPHMFVEMSEELAAEKGIRNKDRILVSSARGSIEAYAMVTKRFKPFLVGGRKIHQVGMPWQFGFKGIVKGGTANRLTAHIADPETTMPEYKTFLCDIRRVD